MDNVEKFPSDPIATEACSQAILTLWKHRSVLPEHLRPLGELEPVMRTLSALDVGNEEHYYFRSALREAATAEVDDVTKEWLDLAISLDYSARSLIQYALRSAARGAALEAEPWLELAREAGESEETEIHTVRFILERDESEKATQAALEDKLARLEDFISLSGGLVSDLRRQLEATKS